MRCEGHLPKRVASFNAVQPAGSRGAVSGEVFSGRGVETAE